MERILLSAPDIRGAEREMVMAAIDSNWIAPAGPDLDAFEAELAQATGRQFCVGLSSGTAGLHLALETAGVTSSDTVLVSTLTFVATPNALDQLGAKPIFIDSDDATWNMDPALVESTLAELAETGQLPKAVVPVDLYGQCANYSELVPICEKYGVAIIADSAESLGASHDGSPAGAFGDSAILSFNGNKIITASGGGALVTDDEEIADRVRHLATQAREPAPYYEHIDRGYNYRLSNILAALGRAQLLTLEERVDRRREINRSYRDLFELIPGISVMPEAPNGRTTFWLTAVTIDPNTAPMENEALRLALEAANIESRPVWKPMHLQPAYKSERAVLNGVSDRLFANGLCLPSGSGMSDSEFDRVLETLRQLLT